MTPSGSEPETRAGEITIEPLGMSAALELAPLIAAYATEMLRGAPRRPDQLYVQRLLQERVIEAMGARLDGVLVGFALYYDLPEAVTGRRAGQLDDLYVDVMARGRGVASKLIQALIEEGRARGWAHLRWLVPDRNPASTRLYEKIAEPARWKSYVVKIDREIDW